MSSNKPNPHEGHRERMRAKLLRDTQHILEDHELVEMLLYYIYPQGDTNEMAHNLLKYFDGNLCSLLEAEPNQLVEAGLTQRGAAFFVLFRELNRAYNLRKINNRFSFKDFDSLLAHCTSLVDASREEQFYVTCFDSKGRRICDIRAAAGTLHSVDVSMRTVMDIAVKNNADSIVIVHNHPNGVCGASVEDISSTQYIEKALNMVNISLIDHIIVANGNTYSMRENNCFDVKVEKINKK